jgi:hypothetical protein
VKLLVALVTLGCTPPRPPGVSPCVRAIVGFASADPKQLVVLPTTCSFSEAGKDLHDLNALSPGELGEPGESANVRFYSSPKLERIQVWERDKHIVLVDAAFPPGNAADYVRELGPPEARLDLNQDDHGSEWVWPGRGVVLVVEGPTLSRVGIFSPQSLTEYQHHARYRDRTTYEE